MIKFNYIQKGQSNPLRGNYTKATPEGRGGTRRGERVTQLVVDVRPSPAGLLGWTLHSVWYLIMLVWGTVGGISARGIEM